MFKDQNFFSNWLVFISCSCIIALVSFQTNYNEKPAASTSPTHMYTFYMHNFVGKQNADVCHPEIRTISGRPSEHKHT